VNFALKANPVEAVKNSWMQRLTGKVAAPNRAIEAAGLRTQHGSDLYLTHVDQSAK
jgi:hypothetical protein